MLYNFEELFEIIIFPSGESHVRLKTDAPFPKENDVILKRCVNWNSVMHLVCANDILKRNEVVVDWFVPFRPFARQDRVTATNHGFEASILRDSLAYINIINLDVHSNAFSNSLTEIKQIDIVDYVLEKRGLFKPSYSWEYPAKYDILWVVPDAGALDKINSQIKDRYKGYVKPKIDFVVCSKKRDSVTGKLSGFDVPIIDKKLIKKAKEVFIIDDICDGGGTFLAIADQLRPQLEPYKKKLNLFVTHGIFSAGFDKLFNSFDRIITTNSFRENSIGCTNLTSNVEKLIVCDVKEIFNECYKK